jgi:hypothetical protein
MDRQYAIFNWPWHGLGSPRKSITIFWNFATRCTDCRAPAREITLPKIQWSLIFGKSPQGFYWQRISREDIGARVGLNDGLANIVSGGPNCTKFNPALRQAALTFGSYLESVADVAKPPL